MDKSSYTTIKSLGILWSYLSNRRKTQLKILLICMVISAIAELSSVGSIIPLLSVITNPEKLWEIGFLQITYKTLGFNKPSDLLLPATVLFAFTCLISASIKAINIWLHGRTAALIGNDLSYICYKNTLLQSYENHIAQNTSSVVSSLINQLDRTVKAINNALTLVTGLIISLFLFITLSILNWVIAIFSLVFLGGIYFVIAFFSKRKLYQNSKVITFSDRSRVKALQEGLGGIREVIMGRTQDIYLKKYLASDIPIRKVIAQNRFIAVFPRYALEAVALILVSFFAYFLNRESYDNEAAIPLLGSILLCAQRLLPVLQSVYASWAGLKGFSNSILQVIEILNLPLYENFEINHFKKIPQFNNLLLKSVTYSYENNSRNVLTNINLEINKGDSIGIIGKTGSGKSTLMDILMGLLKPTNGQILINGNNLYENENKSLLNEWRESLSHVPQNIYLSDSSILENIAFGIPIEKIDIDRVKLSAEKAQLSEFIESCKDGFETFVGERGIKLSGGQRQRIGIARALYKKSRILLLDEATSALDVITEKLLLKELKNMKENLTLIIIAHRLTTVKDCNKIIKVEKGKILIEES